MACLRQLVIDDRLWSLLMDAIRGESLERSFYLVGFSYSDYALVYEIFESMYIDKGVAHIVTDPLGHLLLSNSLPVGLKIIGLIHLHPWHGGAELSSVDIALLDQYDYVVAVVDPEENHEAKMRCDGKFVSVPIIIRKLENSEEPAIIKIENHCIEAYAVFPKTIIESPLLSSLLRSYYPEFLYRVYSASRYNKNKVIPDYKWIKINQIYTMPHIILPQNNQKQEEYLKSRSI